MMSQLFRKFGWRVAGGLDTQQGIESLCLLAMPIVRYALLANDVIVTTWASYADYQLTNSLLRSTVASLKSQARGQGNVRRVVQCQYGKNPAFSVLSHVGAFLDRTKCPLTRARLNLDHLHVHVHVRNTVK